MALQLDWPHDPAINLAPSGCMILLIAISNYKLAITHPTRLVGQATYAVEFATGEAVSNTAYLVGRQTSAKPFVVTMKTCLTHYGPTRPELG
jgi:hypothetical protein